MFKHFYLVCGMFQKFQEKWKVGPVQLFIILLTFALGGTLTGMIGRRIMNLIPVDGIVWVIIYIIVMTLIWPLMVILVSIPMGQFVFFRNYLARIAARFTGKQKSLPVSPNLNSPSTQTPSSTEKSSPVNLAIFASGTGTNARKILEHFSKHPGIKVALVVSNKPAAGVLDVAKDFGVPTFLIEKEEFFRGHSYIPLLREIGIDFIILAGFLWKIPPALVAAYPSRMINIHPALLPKYGGKGMYGKFVHEAVIAAGEKESGITIHYVDEQYDHGATIFQATCPVEDGDTPETLAEKIHALEHAHFPQVVEEAILSQLVKNH